MKKLLFALLSVLAMVGCKTQQGSSTNLNGSTWKLASAIVEGKAYEIPTPNNVDIVFAEGKVSGEGPCNRYGGDYKQDGNIVSFKPMYMTKRACANSKWEYQYMKILQACTKAEAKEGKLTLSGTEGSLTFAK